LTWCKFGVQHSLQKNESAESARHQIATLYFMLSNLRNNLNPGCKITVSFCCVCRKSAIVI
jgi:hypothetical protein